MTERQIRRFVLFAVPAGFVLAASSRPVPAGQGPAVLGSKDRAEVFNGWLKIRLEKVLPASRPAPWLNQGTSLRLAARPWLLSTGERGGSEPPGKAPGRGRRGGTS